MSASASNGSNLLLAALLAALDVAHAAMLPAASQPVFARRLPSDAEVKALEQRLNYNFNNTWGLKLALVHPSYGELNNARCGGAWRLSRVPGRLPLLVWDAAAVPCVLISSERCIMLPQASASALPCPACLSA